MFELLCGPGFFRITLALLVFVDHATRIELGTAAVYIFFELSGYWICRMWLDRYSRTRSSYLTYLISRFWRLLPVFMLASIIAWTLLAWGQQTNICPLSVHQLLSNILIFGYHSLPCQVNVPAWSLDVEMQFYLIAPLAILLAKRNPLLILTISVVISAFAVQLGDSFTMAPYFAFFSIGVVAGSTGWQPSARLAKISLSTTILLFSICVLSPVRDIILGGAHPQGIFYQYNGKVEIIIAFLIAPWAIFTTKQRSSRFDRMLGDLSYVFYLIHFPILVVMNTGIGSYALRLEKIGVALVMIGTVSVAIWLFFDRPINRRRAIWVSHRTK